MNPLQKALSVKQGAEKRLQGIGKQVRKGLTTRKQRIEKKAADFYKQTGSYPG